MCAATSHQLRRRQLYTAPSVCSAARAPCTKQPRACNSGGLRTRNSGVSLLRSPLMKRAVKIAIQTPPAKPRLTQEQQRRRRRGQVNVSLGAEERALQHRKCARTFVDRMRSSAQFSRQRMGEQEVSVTHLREAILEELQRRNYAKTTVHDNIESVERLGVPRPSEQHRGISDCADGQPTIARSLG